jgi:spore maturation protein CgeB
MRPVSFQERVRLYQRAKIGFNVHWNDFGLGNQRLYHLPANGVMQICDCADYLDIVYMPGEEIVGFRKADDLIDKLRYYLEHESDRNSIVLRAFQRTMKEYQFATIAKNMAHLIRAGMDRIAWNG